MKKREILLFLLTLLAVLFTAGAILFFLIKNLLLYGGQIPA